MCAFDDSCMVINDDLLDVGRRSCNGKEILRLADGETRLNDRTNLYTDNNELMATVSLGTTSQFVKTSQSLKMATSISHAQV